MVTAQGRIGPENLEHVKDMLRRCAKRITVDALSEREEAFVEDMTKKVERYGANAFLSDAQYEWLDALAEGEEYK